MEQYRFLFKYIENPNNEYQKQMIEDYVPEQRDELYGEYESTFNQNNQDLYKTINSGRKRQDEYMREAATDIQGIKA